MLGLSSALCDCVHGLAWTGFTFEGHRTVCTTFGSRLSLALPSLGTQVTSDPCVRCEWVGARSEGQIVSRRSGRIMEHLALLYPLSPGHGSPVMSATHIAWLFFCGYQYHEASGEIDLVFA